MKTRTNIINEHETLYKHINTLKTLLDTALKTFEDVSIKDIDTLRGMMMDHARALENILEEC